MRTLMICVIFVGLAIIGAILGAVMGIATPEAATAGGLVGHVVIMAFWGAIGLPMTAVIFGLPIWILVAVIRRFGFWSLLGVVLMFTPLFPVGLFLLLFAGEKNRAKA